MRSVRRRAAVIAATAFLLVGGLAAALSVRSAPAAPSEAAQLSSPPRENVVYLYNPLSGYTDAQLGRLLAGAKYVVVADQADESSPGYWLAEASAAHRIRATGAIPLHYVDYSNAPARRTKYGIDLAAHPDWRFCVSGSRPAALREVGAAAGDYVDLGNPQAMAAARAYVDHLAQVGYAGIHLDGGDLMWLYGAPYRASPTAPPVALADRRSTCGNPTTTLGSGYADLLAWAHAPDARRPALFTVLNCCSPDRLAASRVDGARTALAAADRLLTEDVKASRVPWGPSVIAEGAAAQRTGRIWNFQCARTPQQALYAWARAKLWPQVVVVNTGQGADRGSCATAENKWGVHPELTDARLGAPLDRSYLSTGCAASHCVLERRYADGAVLVALRPTATTVELTPLSRPGCVYVARVVVARDDRPGSRPARPVPVAGGQCVSRLSVPVAAHGAAVLLYRSSPW